MITAANARRLATVTPVLGAAFLEISQRFSEKFYGCRLGVDEGYRSPADQQAKFAQGRSNANGTTTFSYHQALPSLALDFVVLDPTIPNFRIVDGTDARYLWVGRQFQDAGCVWGGSWTHPDWDHVNLAAEAPDGDGAAAAASAWLNLVANAPFLRA